MCIKLRIQYVRKLFLYIFRVSRSNGSIRKQRQINQKKNRRKNMRKKMGFIATT